MFSWVECPSSALGSDPDVARVWLLALAPVVHSLVGVMDQTSRWIPPPQCHLQGISHQLCLLIMSVHFRVSVIPGEAPKGEYLIHGQRRFSAYTRPRRM
jgi:hypothetical protein